MFIESIDERDVRPSRGRMVLFADGISINVRTLRARELRQGNRTFFPL